MHYKPKSTAGLQIALGGLPDKMRVQVDPDIPLSAKTVRELREVTDWPASAAITTPQGHYPESVVIVSRATVATRLSPKS
jgi:hypothetical protein